MIDISYAKLQFGNRYLFLSFFLSKISWILKSKYLEAIVRVLFSLDNQ